jgi:hypothetical protein
VTAAYSRYLASRQTKDGHWVTFLHDVRSPAEDSDVARHGPRHPRPEGLRAQRDGSRDGPADR